MTTQIEDELNLPRLEDALAEARQELAGAVDEATQAEVDRMADALRHLDPSSMIMKDEDGVETHEAEMNDVIDQAMKAHKEILDLAFNVEIKHAGSIFMPAARMLELAVTASKSKADQKLKTLKLRMEREKLNADLQRDRLNGTIDAEVTDSKGDAPTLASIVADRNDLMKKIKDGEL
jgi:hypothetical protein